MVLRRAVLVMLRLPLAIAGCGGSSGSSSGTLAAGVGTVDTQEIEQGIEKSMSVTSSVQAGT